MSNYQCLIEQNFKHIFNTIKAPQNSNLLTAVKYSSLAGGKRIRPLLLFATLETFKHSTKSALNTACALELIHCYSLIHDDLPAMDDDDLRRGKPSCHKKFNEATAILAGDFMQPLAFSLLVNTNFTDKIRLKLIKILTLAAQNMVCGQILDIDSEQQIISLEMLSMIHQNKTGDLISSALLMGAAIAELDQPTTKILNRIGDNLGMFFQIQDDILDHTADSTILGKPAGSDTAQNKNTFVSILGLEKAKKIAQDYCQQVIEDIKLLPNNSDKLMQLTDFIINRAF